MAEQPDAARQYLLRLDALAAMLAAQRDPGLVVDVVAAAEDEETARAALVRGLGVSETGARVVMDLQIRRLTATRRAATEAEAAEVRQRLADLPE
jgi:DNA gyrase/topoisomerase IV subunit A